MSDYQKQTSDLEKEVEQLRAASQTGSEALIGLTQELEHSEASHAVTRARKSVIFQDWLADRTTIWKLRCQLREHGHEPIT